MLSYSELLKLKRWNTPTIYNGWEALSKAERLKVIVNEEETRDFMPQMGPMVGYAVTVTTEPSNPSHIHRPNLWREYREYIGSIPGPKIVVIQDLDKPRVIGSFWGEVNANVHHALGCVGTITDGAVRDVDEMTNAGFKALARRMCVGHAYSVPVSWGCEVEVFGAKIKPGMLIHADKHGFIVIPEEDEAQIVDAAAFMDANECNTVISAARSAAGKSVSQIIDELTAASKDFDRATAEKFKAKGEW